MSLELIVMRHAKSSWSDPCLSDHDRPLNGRGRASAKAIGTWMKEEGYQPDQTLCSTSARTCETLDHLELDTETNYLEPLYHASEDRMLQLLQNRAKGKSVLMLGHNPGAAFFAQAILSKPPKSDAFSLFPTAAVLVVRFDTTNWRDLRFGQGTLAAFLVPRMLLPPT